MHSADGKTVAFFMVNRHPDEAMTVDIDMAGFAPKAIAEHITIAHPDLSATNTATKPDRVVPKPGVGISVSEGGRQRQSRRAVISCGARKRLKNRRPEEGETRRYRAQVYISVFVIHIMLLIDRMWRQMYP